MTKIAIIGAGMAGVSLAYTLKHHADIVLIEKSRGVSGRIAHRRAAQVGFDHGAAYMTIRDPQFADLMAPYISAGLLQNWPQHPVRLASGTATEPKSPSPDSYAVSGAANALVKAITADHLAGIDIRLSTRARQITRHDSDAEAMWRIEIDQGTNDGSKTNESPDILADWVISTAPAPQTADMMPSSANFHQQVSDISMQGCFTLMLGFDSALNIGWDAAWGDHDQPIGFIADNRTKPARDHRCSALAIHAGNQWSSDHLASDPEWVKDQMIAALYARTGIDSQSATHIGFHRWLYANPAQPLRELFVMDTSLQLAAAGDWCLGGRVENAYLSGSALGRAIRALM
jgi:predicted NAD/FAD-dependent oxidoreductase